MIVCMPVCARFWHEKNEVGGGEDSFELRYYIRYNLS